MTIRKQRIKTTKQILFGEFSLFHGPTSGVISGMFLIDRLINIDHVDIMDSLYCVYAYLDEPPDTFIGK